MTEMATLEFAIRFHTPFRISTGYARPLFDAGVYARLPLPSSSLVPSIRSPPPLTAEEHESTILIRPVNLRTQTLNLAEIDFPELLAATGQIIFRIENRPQHRQFLSLKKHPGPRRSGSPWRINTNATHDK